MKKVDALTQDRLKSVLHYNPDTGIFTHIRSGHGVYPGKVAGAIMRGYIGIKIDGVAHRAHRLAFLYITGEMPEGVDHINQKKTDNRFINLRKATAQENNQNRTTPINNTSGAIGVRFDPRMGKWRAQFYRNGKCCHLGFFARLEDAVIARKQAEADAGYHANHGSGVTALAAA